MEYSEEDKMKIVGILRKAGQSNLNKYKLLRSGKISGISLVNITKKGDLVCRVSGTRHLILVTRGV